MKIEKTRKGCAYNSQSGLHITPDTACQLRFTFVKAHIIAFVYALRCFLLLLDFCFVPSLIRLFCLPLVSCCFFLPLPGIAALFDGEPSAFLKTWVFSSARCRLPGLCLAALLLCSALSLRISLLLLLSETLDSCGGADSCLNLSRRSACVSPSYTITSKLSLLILG